MIWPSRGDWGQAAHLAAALVAWAALMTGCRSAGPTAAPTTGPPPAAAVAATVTLVGMGDTIPYLDTVTGFSIEYPSEWRIEHVEDRHVRLLTYPEGAELESSPGGARIEVMPLEVKGLEEAVRQVDAGTSAPETATARLGGRPATLVVLPPDNGAASQAYFVDLGGRFVLLRGYGDPAALDRVAESFEVLQK